MPANAYSEVNTQAELMEDQRALQLAFELSMLGLNSSSSEDENFLTNNFNMSPQCFAEEQARRSSANMTECVPVPSSEHVAEIVGRQGCKIKALRAKTNTYIKTPVRGEEPVFVVTGRKDDVQAAKREILSAAEHFSQIRASRRNSIVTSISGNAMSGPPSPNAPGQVTIQVPVPYKVVGLVVGPKGATIKKIQQQTQTYIITPSRDKQPIFEVSGLPDNVQKARQEIESHIALRTGSTFDNQPDIDFYRNGIDSGFHELKGSSSDVSAFTAYNNVLNGGSQMNRRPETLFNFPPVNDTKVIDFGLVNGLGSTFNRVPNIYDSLNDEGIGSPSFENGTLHVWSDVTDDKDHNNLVSSYIPMGSRHINSARNGLSIRISPATSDMSTGSSATGTNSTSHTPPLEHSTVRRIYSDPSSAFTPLATFQGNLFPGLRGLSDSFNVGPRSNAASALSVASPRTESRPLSGGVDSLTGLSSRRLCIVCAESEVVAFLVPCGHHLFCMECANMIAEKRTLDKVCPACHKEASKAIRAIS